MCACVRHSKVYSEYYVTYDELYYYTPNQSYTSLVMVVMFFPPPQPVCEHPYDSSFEDLNLDVEGWRGESSEGGVVTIIALLL